MWSALEVFELSNIDDLGGQSQGRHLYTVPALQGKENSYYNDRADVLLYRSFWMLGCQGH